MSSQTPAPQAENFDDAENISSNPTNNREFRDVLQATMSRRNMMVGTLAAAGATFLAPAPAQAVGYGWYKNKKNKDGLIGFDGLSIEEATAAKGKTVTVSSDYEYQVLIPWGTPINPSPNAPEYTGDPNNRPTAAEAEQQVGLGHDGMWFFPGNLPRVLKWESYRGRELPPHIRNKVLWDRYGMLCVNHEFGANGHVFGYEQNADGSFKLDEDGDKIAINPQSLADVKLSQAVHGVSVVALYQSRSGDWRNVSSKNNRRITVNTPVEFSGPVADTVYLENDAKNDPRGTVNNCGAGPTPWGTYLTCEENFNGYFGATSGVEPQRMVAGTDAFARYGFSANGFGYGWHLKYGTDQDERFDLSSSEFANESNRFGWCVEIDAFDSSKPPVKRTALGRFKHESAAFLPEKFDERAVCYMGDDQRGDYCYKYVSNLPWREHIKRGQSPLDHGKLYVARFDEGRNDDNGKGRGEWIWLSVDNAKYPDLGKSFKTQAELLTYARIAADIVGATKMDRPEWSTIGTKGEVYWTMTNNDRKGRTPPQGALSEANPIFDNTDGHIIKTEDLTDTRFKWSIFILARNTRNPRDPDALEGPKDLGFTAYDEPEDGGEYTFTDPDAAWADPYGRLFIGTDGGQPSGLQDQLVVMDTTMKKPSYKRLLMGVNSDEITGITTTPDYKTMFTNTQHPGDGDPEATNFPASPDGKTIPRDCTIVLHRKDGGIVGS